MKSIIGGMPLFLDRYSPLEFQLHEGPKEHRQDLVWSTPAVTIHRHPPATRDHRNNRELLLLFESVSKLSGMTAMDAIALTRQGGRCCCRELTAGWLTISPDCDMFLTIDLYNAEGFFALYDDANCFKRVATWSLEEMARASFRLDPPTQIDLSVVAGVRTRRYQLKNMSADLVYALALVTCYTSPRRGSSRFRSPTR
ncbi:hypothetical protein Pmar_PMAR023392 [Perkinsus marinus ATCC 50983]|uniref:Uncharacterized protein n=1 Tax=Perkinsus marinus (strain ATCC 50983 / TXsc) TaxID=423536 RepID=C5KKF4_PERM5|nr:hypothetical protein Pmar_PMAR023392 [Perkinsus marinus ATCC 50983]EER15066.1 hypothetical protein Pmar_PMAR023392 [Perkinsus marinus ATCC 50983]|eukprot:XP_002783270.1 hypothetical protein Pmar_PMAR023392 [Perkinsus marinus ATCC 50983]